MHPTISDQLAGIGRLLDSVEQDGLSADASETMTNVRRLIRHVDRSWSQLLPFYREDNIRLANLLNGLSQPDVPVPSSSDDVNQCAHSNRELRDELTGVITRLPAPEQDLGARAQIAAYLLRRIDEDPTWS